MRTIIVKIDDNERIKGLHFLYASVENRQKVISDILANPDSNINAELFQSYSKGLDDLYAQYDMEKQKITEDFIPDYLKGHELTWTVNFARNELKIDITCDCPIPEVDNCECCAD